MFPRVTLKQDRAKLKLATANVFLVANAFIWYLLAFNGIRTLLAQQNASDAESLLVIGINTGAIALSGLLGTLFINKFKSRKRFLYIWLIIGIALSIIPLGLNVNSLANIEIISLMFGLYFGIGMPATMGYHSGSMRIESRAKMGGFAFLIIGTTFALAGLVSVSSLLILCIILTGVRICGLAIFHFTQVPEEPLEKKQVKNSTKYGSILSNKSFILYFIPWGMFTLVNFLTVPIQVKAYPSQELFNFLTAMENVVIAFAAVFSGFIADKWGRKRLTIIGFIMLGIGYAVIGLSFAIYSSDLTSMILPDIIFSIVDGIAWGIFYVLFLFTIWGDLALNQNSDKFYFIGALPFISSYFLRLFFTPSLSSLESPSIIFTFASFFLFLAVLPLVYAPETLPEKLIKDRDLKSYVEKAKKKAMKETFKVHRKEKQHAEETDRKVQASESGKDNEDAAKLAEKYY